jgi:hypothetical protein
MKIDDINRFKGELKSAIQEWCNGKIDELFKNPVSKTFAKNGLNNALTRYDDKLNNGIDFLWMFISDEHGEVDSSVMIDNINAMLKEMEVKEYDMGGFLLSVGNGEISVSMPKNIFMDMLVGCSKVRFTSADSNEFKNLLI